MKKLIVVLIVIILASCTTNDKEATISEPELTIEELLPYTEWWVDSRIAYGDSVYTVHPFGGDLTFIHGEAIWDFNHPYEGHIGTYEIIGDTLIVTGGLYEYYKYPTWYGDPVVRKSIIVSFSEEELIINRDYGSICILEKYVRK